MKTETENKLTDAYRFQTLKSLKMLADEVEGLSAAIKSAQAVAMFNQHPINFREHLATVDQIAFDISHNSKLLSESANQL